MKLKIRIVHFKSKYMPFQGMAVRWIDIGPIVTGVDVPFAQI